MKIAIYHPWIYLKSGLERTILEIARRSRHDIVIYTSHYDRLGTYPELESCDIHEVNKVSVDRDYGSVLKAGRTIAATKLELEDVDVLVISCDGLGTFLTLRNSQRPLVNLCFTPLRALYDDEYRLRHQQQHASKRWFTWILESGYRLVDKLLWRRYSRIVCISETIRKRVLAAGLARPDKLCVLYPGIDEKSIENCPEVNPYFFLPGRIMWTKNLALGIKAFLMFRAQYTSPFKLVIAGMVDAKSQAYYQELKELASASDDVQFVIEPSDDEMQSLYRHCHAVLFTAFNEDLGLTPMEAMAKGKPVISVNKGGPLEVVDDGVTGMLVDNDPVAFSRAMQTLAEDSSLVKRLGAAGQARVERFTWRHFVEELDKLLEDVASGNTSP